MGFVVVYTVMEGVAEIPHDARCAGHTVMGGFVWYTSDGGVAGKHSEGVWLVTHSGSGCGWYTLVMGCLWRVLHSDGGVAGTHSDGGVAGTHSDGGVAGTHSDGGVAGIHSDGVWLVHTVMGVWLVLTVISSLLSGRVTCLQ